VTAVSGSAGIDYAMHEIPPYLSRRLTPEVAAEAAFLFQSSSDFTADRLFVSIERSWDSFLSHTPD
jgi:hypothetical protein